MAYKDIINNLKSDGAVFRCQGILECLKSRNNTGDIPDLLKELKSDGVIILGRSVGKYASAALDILGEEKYEGKDEDVIKLISDLKELLPSS